MDNAVLSYVVELVSHTTAGATLMFNPYGTQGSVTSIYFSIMIITEANNYA